MRANSAAAATAASAPATARRAPPRAAGTARCRPACGGRRTSRCPTARGPRSRTRPARYSCAARSALGGREQQVRDGAERRDDAGPHAAAGSRTRTWPVSRQVLDDPFAELGLVEPRPVPGVLDVLERRVAERRRVAGAEARARSTGRRAPHSTSAGASIAPSSGPAAASTSGDALRSSRSSARSVPRSKCGRRRRRTPRHRLLAARRARDSRRTTGFVAEPTATAPANGVRTARAEPRQRKPASSGTPLTTTSRSTRSGCALAQRQPRPRPSRARTSWTRSSRELSSNRSRKRVVAGDRVSKVAAPCRVAEARAGRRRCRRCARGTAATSAGCSGRRGRRASASPSRPPSASWRARRRSRGVLSTCAIARREDSGVRPIPFNAADARARAPRPRAPARDLRHPERRRRTATARRADPDRPLADHERPQPRRRLPAPARALRTDWDGGARRAARGGRGGDPAGRHLEGQVGADPGDPARDRRAAATSTGCATRRSRESRDYLCALPGVGRKTAACVLLFSFGLRDVPVDTHVSRVGTRLGAAARPARRSRSSTTRCSR